MRLPINSRTVPNFQGQKDQGTLINIQNHPVGTCSIAPQPRIVAGQGLTVALRVLKTL